MTTATGTKFDRAGLLVLLEATGFDTSELTVWNSNPFRELTAAELRTLVAAGFLELDGDAHESLDYNYFLDLMDRTGAVAYGEFSLYADEFSLSIEGLDLHSTDAEKQVALLRGSLGCDEVYDLDDGGIGVWWD